MREEIQDQFALALYTDTRDAGTYTLPVLFDCIIGLFLNISDAVSAREHIIDAPRYTLDNFAHE